MSGYEDRRGGGVRGGRYQSMNPFEYLATVDENSPRASRASTQTPPSRGPSASSSEMLVGNNGYDGVEVPKQSPAPTVTYGLRTCSNNIVTSPVLMRTQGTTLSPQAHRRGTPNQAASRGRRESVARATALVHPSICTNSMMRPQTMYCIPEELAVQEFAWRKGQQDRNNPSSRIPSNPFHSDFDMVWTKFYDIGKNSIKDSAALPAQLSSSHENPKWPALINAYTQSPEHPEGIFDGAYVWNTCVQALNGMEEVVRNACKRVKDFDRMVCDLPSHIVDAIHMYPDLLERYKTLKQDGREAVGGGLPSGYV